MQKTKEADQPKTHPSSGSVISMSGVISAVCAALMLVMFLLAFFSEIVGRGGPPFSLWRHLRSMSFPWESSRFSWGYMP